MKSYKEFITETIDEQSYNLAMRPPEDDPEWFGRVFGDLEDLELKKLLYDLLIGTAPDPHADDKLRRVGDERTGPMLGADPSIPLESEPDTEGIRDVIDAAIKISDNIPDSDTGKLRLDMDPDGSGSVILTNVGEPGTPAPSDWGSHARRTVTEETIQRRTEIKQVLNEIMGGLSPALVYQILYPVDEEGMPTTYPPTGVEMEAGFQHPLSSKWRYYDPRRPEMSRAGAIGPAERNQHWHQEGTAQRGNALITEDDLDDWIQDSERTDWFTDHQRYSPKPEGAVTWQSQWGNDYYDGDHDGQAERIIFNDENGNPVYTVYDLNNDGRADGVVYEDEFGYTVWHEYPPSQQFPIDSLNDQLANDTNLINTIELVPGENFDIPPSYYKPNQPREILPDIGYTPDAMPGQGPGETPMDIVDYSGRIS